MIKKFLLIGAVVLFFAACGNDSDNDGQPNDTTDITTLEEIAEIALADFESKAGNFVNKEVKISGIVDHLCKHSGKKILLVDGDNSLHVFSDERYDEALSGSQVSIIGLVEEEKIDEAYLTEWWNHAQGSHGEGTDADKEYLANLKIEIQAIRDSLKNEGVEYFSEYSLKYVSHKEKVNK